jgi:hypothetical protein
MFRVHQEHHFMNYEWVCQYRSGKFFHPMDEFTFNTTFSSATIVEVIAVQSNDFSTEVYFLMGKNV